MFNKMLDSQGIEIESRHRGADNNDEDTKEWLEHYFVESHSDVSSIIGQLEQEHPDILPTIKAMLKVRDFQSDTDLNAAIGRLSMEERAGLADKLQEMFSGEGEPDKQDNVEAVKQAGE